jgi:holo-[acyl-carrier protein] synthase
MVGKSRLRAPAAPPMSVIGVGIDIIEIERVRTALERGGERFLTRVFSKTEAEYCRSRRHPARHFAARFAAKESVIKALRVPPGMGWLWRAIEVAGAGGPPTIRLSGRARERADQLGVSALHLSISHSDAHAVAVVVLA